MLSITFSSPSLRKKMTAQCCCALITETNLYLKPVQHSDTFDILCHLGIIENF